MATISECRKGVGEKLGGDRVVSKVARRNAHLPPPVRTEGMAALKSINLLLAELHQQMFWRTAER